MPIERRLDPATRVLWTTMRDGLTVDEIRRHIEALNEMEANRYSEIVDTRGAEPLFPAKEFPNIARYARRMLGHLEMAPRAVVVSENDLVSFGLARLFSALVGPWVTVRVFDNVPAAATFIEMTAASRE